MRATELMFRNPAQATPGFYDSDVRIPYFSIVLPIAYLHWRCCAFQVNIQEQKDKSPTKQAIWAIRPVESDNRPFLRPRYLWRKWKFQEIDQAAMHLCNDEIGCRVQNWWQGICIKWPPPQVRAWLWRAREQEDPEHSGSEWWLQRAHQVKLSADVGCPLEKS